MARSLTRSMREAIYASRGSREVLLLLVTIDHPSFEFGARRFTLDLVPTISRGQEYQPFPFELTLPDDDPEQSPRASISVDNIDRAITTTIRGIPSSEPPTVLIELVRAAAPDLVEQSYGPMLLAAPEGNANTVSGELVNDDGASDPFPADRYTPDLFPALHRRV